MGTCGNINEARRIVENYHLYSDSKFIAFIEANLVQKNTDKTKNYSKLNDPVNLYDDTLLHYAVFHNKEKLIKYLLEHRADPFKTNKRKQSPYDIAKKKNLNKVMEMFDKLKENK